MNPSNTQKAVFVHSPELEQYSYPPECPFKASRAGKARSILASMGLLDGRAECSPMPATRETLERFHTAEYLDTMQRAAKGHLDIDGFAMGFGTPDCPVFVGMYEYAALACGATIAAAELILSGEATIAFNPSGGYHHAGPDYASGFCYINDIVLACMALTRQQFPGRREQRSCVGRVLFLDVDVHHCNGVQDAFQDRSDVMTISFHESGKTLYPGTGFENEIGTGEGRGYSVNVPLPVGTYDEMYMKAFRAIALPLIEVYDPEVIVLELGMDCLSGDPLAHLNLTNNCYADVVECVLSFGKPILAAGGGGYHVENTARGWALAWAVMCGEAAHDHTMGAGMGGVMLESTDWLGGLRDRTLAPDIEQLRTVPPAIDAVIEAVKANVFPLHGL